MQQLEPARRDRTGLDRREHRAPGLGAMAAVAEPASAGERRELGETALDLRRRERCASPNASTPGESMTTERSSSR